MISPSDPGTAVTGPPRRPRPGQWVCSHGHDVVTPLTGGPVPVCPYCRRMVLLAVRPRGKDYVVVQEPVPEHCDGPDQHPFGPNLVRVGWSPCACPGQPRPHSSGHRTWRCERCPSEIIEGVTA